MNKSSFTLYLDVDMMKDIEKKCREVQRSISWFINEMVKKNYKEELKQLR